VIIYMPSGCTNTSLLRHQRRKTLRRRRSLSVPLRSFFDTDTGNCAISDGYERDYLVPRCKEDVAGDSSINLMDDACDNEGFLDGYETAHGSDPLIRASVPGHSKRKMPINRELMGIF
jgi:hypothetical protein